jgi:hypothetical protein
VQRAQNTDEGNEPKKDDTGREPKAPRSLMAHPELPFLTTTGDVMGRRQVALCRGSPA